MAVAAVAAVGVAGWPVSLGQFVIYRIFADIVLERGRGGRGARGGLGARGGGRRQQQHQHQHQHQEDLVAALVQLLGLLIQQLQQQQQIQQRRWWQWW